MGGRAKAQSLKAETEGKASELASKAEGVFESAKGSVKEGVKEVQKKVGS
jgi:uncharacterized protein YjbJ (UPF0337 family)